MSVKDTGPQRSWIARSTSGGEENGTFFIRLTLKGVDCEIPRWVGRRTESLKRTISASSGFESLHLIKFMCFF